LNKCGFPYRDKAIAKRALGAVEKPNKLRQKRERSKKQGLGTRRFSACLYLLFTAAGLFQHTHCCIFLNFPARRTVDLIR